MAAINQVKSGVDAAAAGSAPGTPKPASAAGKPDASAASAFSFQDLGASLTKGKKETLDLLSDVQLQVRIELGRTRMYVEDVLQLGDGAVVELDKLAGDPVDVFVNDRHVARGEVLVLNDNFCVRINEILDPGAETKN
ncbi:MAG: flagellar motor switch protein FliN [Planctomycetes bacterium]|nr:flagellar motor switch protein FliN [Planctomycetota bacterium]